MAVWQYGKLAVVAKLTFSLDEETARQIRRLAATTRKSQSTIVREAIAHYEANPPEQHTSSEERARLLRVIDEIISRPSDKNPEVTRRELEELREARRGPHRLHPVD